MTPLRAVVIDPDGKVLIVPRPQYSALEWPALTDGEYDTRLLSSHAYGGWWGNQPLRLDVFAEEQPRPQTMAPLMMEVIHQLAPDMVTAFEPDIYGARSAYVYREGAWSHDPRG